MQSSVLHKIVRTKLSLGYPQKACACFFSTSSTLQGKRNFRKFKIPNKRGFVEFREKQSELGLVDHQGVRIPGYKDYAGKFHRVPEMVPELIVPDLTDFKLKPYVSYTTTDIEQAEFTAKDLFDSVYAKKIFTDFNSGNLDEHGNPLNPSEDEKMTVTEAKIKARRTGSDIFTGKCQN